MFRNEGKYKKKNMIIIVVLMVLTVIFVSDNVQQKRFEQLRIGYEKMEKGNYEQAIQSFDEYLLGKTKIYWKLMDLCSGEDSLYTRNKVLDAKKRCEEMEDF